MNTPLLVIDTETGGLDPERHALLSVAAVDSTTEECFVEIIAPDPEWIVEHAALEKNGLSLDFLKKNGRPEREVMQDLSLWLAARRFSLLAGCNVAFDRDFLRAAFRRHGLTWPMGKSIDLQAAAWLAHEVGGITLPVGADKLPRLSLEHIAAALDFGRVSDTHNALEDALLTLSCFKTLTRTLEMSPR